MAGKQGHIGILGTEERALMSEHFAQKCCGEAARAVMSEHLAQQSQRAVSPQFTYRYQ
ncbi:hypothetical protein [Adlercreutzia faecimuris]|uniref:Uncharacterized protein n=1 Tax=Adlercreutzia faecimuris TaxID=2897341 RepID=A0ABS9WDA9_9ACTN|nr:hypothetical protein [Adlercreutzia sp. JBNU-10]MCI2240853.1 hypothetical protein [Adlercreutzia sp. JBNU-10]